jgi:small subunit ribosomal protein S16
MAVKIRLYRIGRRNLPVYRVVATDSRSAPRGKFLEMLGSYHPVPLAKTGNKYLRLKSDRVKYWLAVGAQPSDTVARLLAQVNLLPQPPMRSTVPKELLVGKYSIPAAVAPSLLARQRKKSPTGEEKEELPIDTSGFQEFLPPRDLRHFAPTPRVSPVQFMLQIREKAQEIVALRDPGLQQHKDAMRESGVEYQFPSKAPSYDAFTEKPTVLTVRDFTADQSDTRKIARQYGFTDEQINQVMAEQTPPPEERDEEEDAFPKDTKKGGAKKEEAKTDTAKAAEEEDNDTGLDVDEEEQPGVDLVAEAEIAKKGPPIAQWSYLAPEEPDQRIPPAVGPQPSHKKALPPPTLPTSS